VADTAGYSGTPLPRKLGITEGTVVTLLGPPTGFDDPLTDLPDTVTVRRRLQGRPDVVVAFFTRRADLERRIEALGRAVFPAASVWIAWPKKASGVATDITEDTVREVALPLGLVDVKVCAIDAVWSGLKLMWRRDRR
jgi:hypothetical protein